MSHPIQLRTTTDFVVKTAAGVVIQTSDCSDLALKFARENRDNWPGLYVESVQTVTTTRRLWTDRASMGRAA